MKVRLLSSAALILSAAVIEAGSWAHLGLQPPFADGLRYFLLLHAVACMLLAAAAARTLSESLALGAAAIVQYRVFHSVAGRCRGAHEPGAGVMGTAPARI